MTIKQLNILRVYNRANEAQLNHGLTWYMSVHDEANRLGKISVGRHKPIGLCQAAGIISALSPGLRWERNIEAAELLIRRESLQGVGVRYRASIRKAEAIRDGLNADKAFKRTAPKTRSFWRLICAPQNSLTVCVDFHAYSIWLGERVTLEEMTNFKGDSGKGKAIRHRLYYRIVGDYIHVARDVGILPCQLQAITWGCWRDMHNVSNNGNGRETISEDSGMLPDVEIVNDGIAPF